MRYWVYQDSRILGPFDKDDLGTVPGLSQDSLICKSDASGVRDNDWQALAAIPELLSAPRAAAGLSMSFSEGASEFDAFRGAAHSAIDQIGVTEFSTGIFDAPGVFDPWSGAPGDYGSDAVSRAARMRAEDLETTLSEMRARLAEYEAKQDDILGRLSLKDEELRRKDAELNALRDRYASDLAAAAAPPPMPIAPLEDFEIPDEPPPPVFEAKAPAEAPKPRRSLKNPAGVPEPPAPPPLADAPAAPQPDPALAHALEEKEKILEHQKKALAALRAKVEALESKPLAPLPPLKGEVTTPLLSDLEAAPPLLDDAPPLPELSVAPLKTVAADPAFTAPSTQSLSHTAGLPPTEMFTPPAPEEVAPEFTADAPAPEFDAAAPALEPEITLRGAETVELPELQPIPGMPSPAEELLPPQTEAQALGEMPPSAWEGPTEHGGPATDEPTAIDMSPGPSTKPKTMLFGSGMLGGPTPVPGTGPISLQTPVPGHTPTPMPIPLGQTPPPTPMPGQGETPMPMMGQPDIPQTVLQGMGVGSNTTPIPGMPPADTGSFDDLLGKPSTVPPSFGSRPTTGVMAGLPGATETAPAPSKLKRLQSKGFLIAIGAAAVALVLIMLYFLKDPKKVKQMVEMSPEQTQQGSLEDPTPVVGAPEQPANIDPLAPQPQAAPTPEAAPTPQPEPEPQPAPAAARDFIEDKQVEAMDRVKGHVLDEERGSISNEFDFRYPPPYMPEWSAGAVEKDIWLVEYRVFDNMRAKKPRITYSFEVDLAGGGLIGRNDSAKSLLGGKPAETPKAKPRAQAKPKAKPKRQAPRKTAARAPARDAGQLPLPEEEDLDGFGAQSPGGFNNPGGGE